MSDAPTDEVKLNDLMFQVLDHAVASIKDVGGPLIPFSITEDAGGEKKLNRYVTERLEEGEAQAKKKVEEMKASIVRYAIAWDGFVIIEGKKWDALLIEVVPESWTGRIVNPKSEKRSQCPRSDVSTVPI